MRRVQAGPGMNNYRAAGGTNSFRTQMNTGYLPSENSIDHAGCFGKYQFETGEEKERLFSTIYTSAYSPDPISGEMEHYICVGMNSCKDGAGFYQHGGRPPLAMVLTIDISGSMSSDSKLTNAKTAMLTGLLPRLKPTDRLAVLAFDDRIETLSTLKEMSNIDLPALQDSIQKLNARGGTNLELALRSSAAALENIAEQPDQEKRIFLLTDMLVSPNDTHLIDLMKSLGMKKIYTTFVGIGADFNVELANVIGRVKGCTFLTVTTEKEFKKSMTEEFDYLVSPDCFDSVISFVPGALDVQYVYGSPGYEHPKSGVLFEMPSSFPSLKDSPTMTKGGVMLIKTAMPKPGTTVEFTLQYTDRSGKRNEHRFSHAIPPPPPVGTPALYQGSGVRKAILLARYVNFIRNYLHDARQFNKTPSVNSTAGIPPAPIVSAISTHLTPSQAMSAEYIALTELFEKYFLQEAEEIGDKLLAKELALLQELKAKTGTPASPTNVTGYRLHHH